MERGSKRSGKGLHGDLPTALQLHILSLLAPNERALSGRLVSPDAAAGLSGPHNCTASLSHPLPPHAVPWAVEAGRQHVRQLPFWHKLQLLCTAAASGSEVNLEVALALLQPSIFPELLQSYDHAWAWLHVPRKANPGLAAVTAGHPQLLGWLLSHCPGLVECWQVLKAAARHCDLAGLQAVFGALAVDPAEQSWILDAAAESATPDAVAKMEWLLPISNGGRSFQLQESTAAAAACSGDLGRLRWLRERGCPMGGPDVLQSALQHADLAVAQWLMDEAGCELPPAVDSVVDDNSDVDDVWVFPVGDAEVEGGRHACWGSLLEAAAKSSDGLAKVGWLQQRRGAQPQTSHWEDMAGAAADQGRVEMVQHALSALRPGAVPSGLVFRAMVSGSISLMQFLRQVGAAFDRGAYVVAATNGSLAMVRWLACEAGVSAVGVDLSSVVFRWPQGPTAATSRELLQAVQLLVEDAGWRGWEDTAELVAAAAGRGDLALVQYLLQQKQQHQPGYQPDWGVGLAAADGGCEALL